MTEVRKTERELPTTDVEALTDVELEAVAGGTNDVDTYYASLSPEQRALAHKIMSQQR